LVCQLPLNRKEEEEEEEEEAEEAIFYLCRGNVVAKYVKTKSMQWKWTQLCVFFLLALSLPSASDGKLFYIYY